MLALACGAVVSAHAQAVPESPLKAAYAYNFLVLATWPRDTGPSLRLCVAGAAPPAFEALGGKTAGERQVSVLPISTPERVHECQALFIPAAFASRSAPWIAAAAGRPILTISELPDGRHGAIVNMRSEDGRVVFDVDVAAASAARIGLSSQLLKLAAVRY